MWPNKRKSKFVKNSFVRERSTYAQYKSTQQRVMNLNISIEIYWLVYQKLSKLINPFETGSIKVYYKIWHCYKWLSRQRVAENVCLMIQSKLRNPSTEYHHYYLFWLNDITITTRTAVAVFMSCISNFRVSEAPNKQWRKKTTLIHGIMKFDCKMGERTKCVWLIKLLQMNVTSSSSHILDAVKENVLRICGRSLSRSLRNSQSKIVTHTHLNPVS